MLNSQQSTSTPTIDAIPNTNVHCSGKLPVLVGGSPLQKSLGHAQSKVLGSINGNYQISYNYFTANSEINVSVNSEVEGDLIIKSERKGAVCGKLNLTILENTKAVLINETGQSGLAEKSIIISAEQNYPIEITLGTGANTPHHFMLDINGEEAGIYTLESSHSLLISDKLENQTRKVHISRI